MACCCGEVKGNEKKEKGSSSFFVSFVMFIAAFALATIVGFGAFIVMGIAQSKFPVPAITEHYNTNPIWRTMEDPLMAFALLYPVFFAFSVSIILTVTRISVAKMLQIYTALSIPGLCMSFATMALPIEMIAAWFVDGIVVVFVESLAFRMIIPVKPCLVEKKNN